MRLSTSALFFAAASVVAASPLGVGVGAGVGVGVGIGNVANVGVGAQVGVQVRGLKNIPTNPTIPSYPGANACGVTPDQVAALSPLLHQLGLATTVDGVKQLVNHILRNLGGLILQPVGGLLNAVTGILNGLLGVNIPLDGTVTALANLIAVQVPCILDTVLPNP
ncbi:hypothetical protein LPJ61_004896 [Coemansia biformis]|uniref:Uncharacterized protein n=1 Tax=Coemansia biformis TaxID=1286918 RepID=A0A9W7Y8M1_9FUNG|nr:hypothetical protein LPJ61_004896 [Coemansia biformis]